MSNPSAPTAASPAVSQLATWWHAQDDATKLIFNQLYRSVPDQVLEVLTKGQLTPDPAHTSIDQIVAPAGDNAFEQQPRVDVLNVTMQPEYPKANEDFTVSFERETTGPLPEHSDAIQILGSNGTPVDERPLAKGATSGPTKETVTEKFQGLPTGTYQVVVWGNIEGNDGMGVPTAQGIRGYSGAPLYVGDTREAQLAQTAEPASKARGALQNAQYYANEIAKRGDGVVMEDVATLDQQFRDSLAEAAIDLRGVSSLGQGFQDELVRVGNWLQNPIGWGNLARDGEIPALAQRIGGLVAMDIVGSPGDVGVALIEIVDNLYG